MLNIGPLELMVVLVVALLVLGPNKLPDAARQVGRALGELRRLSSGFQAEMRDALREPVDGKPVSASGAAPKASSGVLSAPRPPAGEVATADRVASGTEGSANGVSSGAAEPAPAVEPDRRVGPDRTSTEPGNDTSEPGNDTSEPGNGTSPG